LAVAVAIAFLAVGLRAGNLAAWAFLSGALAITFLAVGLRAGDVATWASLAGALAIGLRAGDVAALAFLAGALAIGLRAGDVAALAFLAGAEAGARFAAVLLADSSRQISSSSFLLQRFSLGPFNSEVQRRDFWR